MGSIGAPSQNRAIMASNTVILLVLGLIIAGASADFVVHMDPCEVNVGDAVLITCHVINEDPYGPAWAWFRYSADGTHEIIGRREMMMNAYLEERGYSLDDPVRNAEYDEEATKEALHVRNYVSGCMSTLPSLLIITAAVLS